MSPQPAVVIEFNSVTKIYRSLLGRSVTAVEEFSLQVAEGEVLGIAGPNGAGKSTLISLLLGYIRPTSGSLTIAGVGPRKFVEEHGIGYLSELMTINPAWTAESALARFATLAGVPRADIGARVDVVIEQLGIDEHRQKKVKALSKGNLQRLGLAQSLLREEKILILDEPTHGLDPLWTQRFRGIVEGLRRPGRTLIIASHNLDELQRLADRVAIIDHGKLQRLVRTGYDQTTETAGTYRIAIVAGADRMKEIFPSAVDTGGGEFEVPIKDVNELNSALARAIGEGVLVASVVPARSVLEQQFREAVGETR
ncbi:MAG TPA: ABC transporter ATP-binding protein [Gemmatimonadaceae bacterium]|nr:ABC transporter ATP-binding protein [Gemmatimonadaceae bacterium]